MPKRILPLTDLHVKTAKPKAKEYKLTDGGGLYLLITPSGGKLWRFNYRFDEKYKTLFLKSYPEITLSDARKARDDARKLLANGVNEASRRFHFQTCSFFKAFKTVSMVLRTTR